MWRDDGRAAIRTLHGPEPALADAGRAVAVLRVAGLRQPVGLRPSDPAQPTGRAVSRGLDAARRAGSKDGAGADRGARQLEYLSPPGPAREGGGDARPYLERTAGAWHRGRLVRPRASGVRDRVSNRPQACRTFPRGG